MLIEAGKMYVDRDQRLHGPMVRRKDQSESGYPWRCPKSNSCWTVDGEFIGDNCPDSFDLVAELAPIAAEVPEDSSNPLTPTDGVVEEVRLERIRQDRKWGQQNHGPLGWLAILAEEFGEVSKEVCELDVGKVDGVERLYRLKCYRDELIQVAAVAVAMVESFDRNEGKQ
jgi:hypothetical protein